LPKAWYVNARVPGFLAEVARRAGIAKSTLSQLESGNGNPSLETLWALCVALDIPLRSCWSRRRKDPGDPPRRRNQSGGRTGPLPGDFTGDLPAGRPPRYLSVADPAGRGPHFSSSSAGSVEHIIVTQARAGRPDGSAGRAGEGDYICYPADQEHVFQALEPDTQALLVAEHH
jgi:transcriptional regulator with XRE-family HTH domain